MRARSMTHCSALTLLLVCGGAMGGEVIRLPSLGGTSCQAWDINDHGQIVGTSEVTGNANAHGVLWENGTPTDLGVWGAPGEHHSHAESINNAGQIVGYNEVAASGYRDALFWDSDLTMRNLGQEMGALGNSVGWDINDQGLVCGQAPLSAGFAKGFVWDAVNGGRTEGTVPGYMGGSNKGVNNAGVVVGHGFFFGDPDSAMLATPDGRGGWDEFEIGPSGFNLSIASAINDKGEVAGFTNAGAPGPWTACIYTQEAPGFVSLGTLPRLENSESYDINEAGVVVGWAWDNELQYDPRAWAYVDGTMYDLNDLLDERGESGFTQLFAATGINESNDIVGYGLTTDGALAGFLIEGFMADACVADLAEPFGVLDFSDVTAFLAAFSAGSGEADLAEPFGVFDFSDVTAFLGAFGAGCP